MYYLHELGEWQRLVVVCVQRIKRQGVHWVHYNDKCKNCEVGMYKTLKSMAYHITNLFSTSQICGYKTGSGKQGVHNDYGGSQSKQVA